MIINYLKKRTEKLFKKIMQLKKKIAVSDKSVYTKTVDGKGNTQTRMSLEASKVSKSKLPRPRKDLRPTKKNL